MAEYSIRFCLRTDKPKKKNGKFPIYLRVRVRDKETKIPTNLEVVPEHWDAKKNEPKYAALRTLLNKKREEIDMFADRMIADGQLLTIEAIKDFNSGKKIVSPERQSFISYFEEYIKRIEKFVEKGKKSKATIATYKTTIRLLKEFKNDFRICDMNLRIIEEFDSYLEEVKLNAPGGRRNKHKNIRTIISDIAKHGIPIKNPYVYFKIPQSGEKDVCLNLDEVEALRKLRPKFNHQSSEYKILQMFLFSCYCGLRFSDVIDLKWSNIGFDSSFIEKEMVKTKTKVKTPLYNQARTVVLELSKGQKLNNSTKVFYPYSASHVNNVLAKLITMAGIEKHITFHDARRTFATLLLQNNCGIYEVSKFLGHKSVLITQRYLKYDMSALYKSASKTEIFGKLKGFNS